MSERTISLLLDERGERTGEDIALVLEVLVQGRARHARLPSDVRHGGAGKPAGRKYIDRGRRDQRALWVIMFAQELLSGKGQIASFYLQPRTLLSMRR